MLEKPLREILDKLISDFKNNTNIAIALEINLVSPLNTEITTTLYRIIQEALTNITKHSHATRVKLHLQQTASKICLSIEDNGCGFNPTDNISGFGLQGMLERTEALHGHFTINSEDGKGCQIIVELPLSLVDDRF